MSRLVNMMGPADLWSQRVDEMGLTLEDSAVWSLVQRVHEELTAAGIDFRPSYYVANEWGCPDGQPLIGLPFYLVDPRLHSFEEEHADDLEDDERILAGIRHEMGHAINYAYRLYDDSEWVGVFGEYGRRYHDDYRPTPFSREYVRHLPGMYAQKHPDEDFAETFAVWLTPGSSWRERYAGWGALRKLDYIDRVMARIGKTAPLLDPKAVVPDPEELAFTVGDFYRARARLDAPPMDELGTLADDDLLEMFPAIAVGTDAASLLWDHRKMLMRTVSGYTGARMYVVKAIIDHVVARLRALGLRVAPQKQIEATAGLTALIGALTGKFLDRGHFADVAVAR